MLQFQILSFFGRQKLVILMCFFSLEATNNSLHQRFGSHTQSHISLKFKVYYLILICILLSWHGKLFCVLAPTCGVFENRKMFKNNTEFYFDTNVTSCKVIVQGN